MSFDGIFTHAMVTELHEQLAGGQVTKIHQPYNNEIILTVRANRTNHKLLLSAHPQYARIQLTEIPYENPMQPPQFTMVLRKHLNRARLESIKQYENDRIVIFQFKSQDEIGDMRDLQLIVEIMGRHANILLVDEEDEKIIELIRHVPEEMSSYRPLMPGAPFKPAPAQDKLNPFDSSLYSEAFERMKESKKESLANIIQETFQGVGRDTAQNIAFEASEELGDVIPSLEGFLEPLRKGEFSPTIYHVDRKLRFTPVEYALYEDLESQSYESLSELLDAYYGDKAERDRVHQKSVEIERLLSNELEKNKKKLKKQEKELDETKYAEDFRIQGEVLTAYMHLVEQGQSEIELPNFYDNEELLTIPLAPRKTPAENAQDLFSQYQKLKNRSSYLTRELRKTRNEINYLESVETQLELASPSDIEAIREELIEEGYIRQKRNKKKGNKNKKAEPHTYYSSDGTLILSGRNNKQNDALTKKADKSEYWLHTKDIPGSHVIVRSKNPSEQTLLEAAQVAAYHSKSRLGSNVPVDYVQVKHVNKPKGGKPGFMIYENQNTLYVTPKKEIIASLKEKPSED